MTRPIGFIGLGNMGSRMVRCLVQAGRPVLGFDVDLEAVAATGAEVCESVRDLAARVDVVLLSLPDSGIVEKVADGPDGLVASSRRGQIVVDLSTSAPASTRRLHDNFADRGVEFLDAGVSGGAAAAARGALTLMVGGSEAALNTVRSDLEHLSTRIFHMGGPGAGHETKLLNNFLNAINLSASSEVLVAARKSGLDVAQVLEVINASSGANWATQNRFPSIVNGDYLEGGLTSNLMVKDIELYAEHLGVVGAPSLHAAGPLAAFGVAIHRGYGEQISNRVVDAIGDLAGRVRVSEKPEASGP